MLTLTEQPSLLCPNSKSRPVRWLITTDEHITNAGAFSVFQVQIDTPGGPNGDDLILAGITFTTDDSQPWTYNTFDPNGSSEQVANNLADAIRANSYFQEYQVFLSSGGGAIWTVNAFNFELKEQDNWTFDDTGLSVLGVTLTDQNGSTPILKNMHLWYRLYNDNLPITKERYSSIPFSDQFLTYTEVPVDLTNVIRSVISSSMPTFDILNTPIQDLQYQEQIHLRYGLVEQDEDCNEIRSLAGVSDPIQVVNSVHQHEDSRVFGPHCPNFQTGVRFLSDRPLNMNICEGSFEWIHIWIENTGLWIGDFRAVYTFYDNIGATIGDINRDMNESPTCWIVPIGPTIPFRPANAVRWEVKIQGQVFDGVSVLWNTYSEVISRTVNNCSCKAAEVYFLEDRGSFRTLFFDKVVSRSIEMDEVAYRLPVDEINGTKSTQYFTEGGRYTEAQLADQVFIVRTKRITSAAERETYEQLLRSPEVYIRTTNDLGNDIMRRIIFPKNSYQTFQSSGATRLEIPFRFNTYLKIH